MLCFHLAFLRAQPYPYWMDTVKVMNQNTAGQSGEIILLGLKDFDLDLLGVKGICGTSF